MTLVGAARMIDADMTTRTPSQPQRVITLDGPAASGKSSAARLVAEALGVPYVSSGLLYRAATHLAQLHGLPLSDKAAIVELLGGLRVDLEARHNEPNSIRVAGERLSGALLHTDAVDASVSVVAKHPQVRAWVDARLRDLGGTFVVEGRDMGTAVFPAARHKFYLTAPAEVRAARRVGERTGDLLEVTAALRRRDALDAAQLQPAEDAEHIDSRDLTLDEVVAWVLGRVAPLSRDGE